MRPPRIWLRTLVAAGVVGWGMLGHLCAQAGPPVVNPFAPRPAVREDARPGYVMWSQGKIECGQLHLTRDTRLKIYDQQLDRQREIPWDRIRRIDCEVEKEWLEKEWRFAEAANDRKVYTGRSYPARIYRHVVTLTDGRKIHGPLSGIVYLQQEGKSEKKVLLHKRDKGPIGYTLSSLQYVKEIHLGAEALADGMRKQQQAAAKRRGTSDDS